MNERKLEVRFLAFLREAAADYNAPPDAPREALWSRIEAEWRAPGLEETRSRRESARPRDGEGRRGTSGPRENLDLDPRLAEAAAAYHAPPETPRDQMWERVEAAWQLRSKAPARVRDAGLEDLEAPWLGEGGDFESREAERPPGRRRVTPWMWGLAVAASLTIGVVIGRESVGEPDPGGAVADAAQIRSEADEGAVGRRPAGEPAAGGAAEAAAGTELAEADRSPAGAPEARPGPTGDRGALGIPGTTAPATGRGADPAFASVAYRTAALRHLSRTETLLTSFRSGSGPGGEDASLSRWARTLLTETRLLLDWGAESEPRLTRLLQELELVLVQIAQLGDERRAEERSLILEGLETRDVLPRLRSAVPAGELAIGRSGV